MRKIINALAVFIVFINMNDTYKVLGVLANLKSSMVISVATLFFTGIYILANFSIFKILWRNKVFKRWNVIIIVYPTVAMIISYILDFMDINDIVYWLFFNLLFGMVFIAAAIIAIKTPAKKLKLFAWGSVITTIIGFIINYKDYAFTQKLLIFSADKIGNQDQLYRALSFFQNPNDAAFTIILYFVFIFSTSAEQNKIKSYLYYGICLLLMTVMVFITGSRTSLIIIFILTVLYIFPLVRKAIARQRKSSLVTTNLLVIFGSIFSFIFLVFLYPAFSGSTTGIFDSSLLQRFSIFTAVANGANVQDDSVTVRLAIIGKYVRYILQNPIFGYGPVFVENRLLSGEFTNVSQNEIFEGAITFGVMYAVVYVIGMIKTYFYAIKKSSYKNYLFNPLAAFIVFLFVLTFSISNLFWFRSMCTIIGFLIGLDIKMQIAATSDVAQQTSDLEEVAIN